MTVVAAPAGHRDRLSRRLAEQVAAAGLPDGPADRAPVTEADLAGLPGVVRRYLRFMDVVGRPRFWSLHARITGRFRLRGLGWMPAEAWQYDSGLEIARIFVMRLRLAGVVPMIGRDTYLRGRGRMLGTLLGRVVVADGEGVEFDTGELTTYLNDAILMAPSMLLGADVSWRGVDEHSFDVTLTDAGRGVTGRVFVDDRGAPEDFSSTDRYVDLPGGPVRAEWRTPVHGWQTVDGRPVPTRFVARWSLPDGPLTYFDGRLTHLATNVSPPRVQR